MAVFIALCRLEKPGLIDPGFSTLTVKHSIAIIVAQAEIILFIFVLNLGKFR